ncbi:MAG TPA: hypothetical protein VFQ88_11285 [Nevskiaceae bacterium]|nr:hypothetical protein [Nevskiaceae bacterium]
MIYRISLDRTMIGTSRITWHSLEGERSSDEEVDIPGMLDQRQSLWLDTQGFPTVYRLAARIQGHDTHIDVQRVPGAIVETVRQGGRTRTRRFASVSPVDWLDNNSFDTLQALLDRNRKRLAAGLRLRVFVPQAQRFGEFTVVRAQTEKPAEAARAQLTLRISLTVGKDTVPLQLTVNAINGVLLSYHQPEREVTVSLETAPTSR